MKLINLLFLILCTKTNLCNAQELFDPGNHPSNPLLEQYYVTESKNPDNYFDKAAIASILKRTYTVPININSPIKASIAYFCADIKYNKGKLKICELNPVPGVSPSVYNVLVDGKKYDAYCPFWKAFWAYTKQFDIPIWFVGPTCKTNALDFDSFFEEGYTYHKSLDDLVQDPLFIERSKKNIADISAISNYSGLIIYNPGIGTSFKQAYEIVENVKQHYPNFLWLNDSAQWFTGDKDLMARLFLNTETQEFKPQWKVYKKIYTPDLATEIIEEFERDMYVIKPTDGTWSGGVTIVSKDDLDATLKLLFEPKQKHKRTGQKNIDYWQNNKSDSFIVEEFMQSQTLTINGNEYNPTLRLAFIISHERNSISFTLLGGGWKTPQIPLNKVGDLVLKHVTLGLPAEFCGLQIDPEDFAMMEQIMNAAGPKIYTEILKNYETTKQDYLAR
ncbi:hypothetical protein K2W90_06120 [Candidatus Babeliales bacterium]|nr:hypothetical protein [Candidatus Babeliales bacterium]